MRLGSPGRLVRETSTPFRRGSFPDGEASASCWRANRHLLSMLRPQKKSQTRAGSTRLAVMESFVLGAAMPRQGSSFIVSPHFFFVEVVAVVFAQPRCIHDVLDALLICRGSGETDAPGNCWHLAAQVLASFANRQQMDDQ